VIAIESRHRVPIGSRSACDEMTTRCASDGALIASSAMRGTSGRPEQQGADRRSAIS
jgi:hypothetical protein